MKDEEIKNIVLQLQRARKQIMKLEDENVELRKAKSSLLREVDENKFKSEEMKQSMDRQPIE